MLNLRRGVVGVVAVLLVGAAGACAGGFSSPCPSGQELREERHDDATSIKARGCVGTDSEDNYRRQGHREFFHSNGQKEAEGSYVDGFQGGETGVTGILIDGREGAWMFWHEDGQKSDETTYRDGEREGLLTRWHENGQKEAEGTWRDGELEGLDTMWHDNGQKSLEWTFRDGELEGLWTGWHDNGQKSEESTYLNGTRTAVTEWDANGTQTTPRIRLGLLR